MEQASNLLIMLPVPLHACEAAAFVETVGRLALSDGCPNARPRPAVGFVVSQRFREARA